MELKQLDALTIVGLGGRFISALSPNATNQEVIPKLWGELIPRLGEVSDRVDRITYGLCEPLDERTGECRYVAGVAVSNADRVPDGMEAVTLPAATYAVFTHRGPVDAMGETMRRIYGELLPASGRRRAPGADLERYDERFDGGADSELEIWIPIEAD
jgi:AraC family transcriptional regulator